MVFFQGTPPKWSWFRKKLGVDELFDQVKWRSVFEKSHGGTEWKRNQPLDGSKPTVDFGVGAPPTLVCFSGDWNVHWGLTDLDFEPWPNRMGLIQGSPTIRRGWSKRPAASWYRVPYLQDWKPMF